MAINVPASASEAGLEIGSITVPPVVVTVAAIGILALIAYRGLFNRS
jgi:hypothetical protein